MREINALALYNLGSICLKIMKTILFIYFALLIEHCSKKKQLKTRNGVSNCFKKTLVFVFCF